MVALLVPKTPAPSSQVLVLHLWLNTTPLPWDRVSSSPGGMRGHPCASSLHPRGFAPALGLLGWGGAGWPHRSSGCLQDAQNPRVGPTRDSKAPAHAMVQPSLGIAVALCKFRERGGGGGSCPLSPHPPGATDSALALQSFGFGSSGLVFFFPFYNCLSL